MHKLLVILAALTSLATATAIGSRRHAPASTSPEAVCHARSTRVNDVSVQWFSAPQEDAAELESWCRGVGTPLIRTTGRRGGDNIPRLEELVVLSWNAHLADGRLRELIADLRAGRLTDGQPIAHFVLLLQELYRRGSDVPEFAPDARSAYAIMPRDPQAPDARDYANTLGLSLAYVPSMRNGAGMLEDRGNAIVSTEPLHDVFALELPFERQRRVAAGAAIQVTTQDGIERLHVLDTHLEPLAAPSSLWILRNPRRRQVGALLELLEESRFQADGVGTVIGGDFNTVQGGAREEAYRKVRAWSRSLHTEDPRSTHMMGRLDYIFARLSPQWQISTTRVPEKYGSDHHPVLARFHRVVPSPLR
jgi:endonuclease/exonuclease/phosphatase family metal-dependent hydrolase